jgi:hypothetical protein
VERKRTSILVKGQTKGNGRTVRWQKINRDELAWFNKTIEEIFPIETFETLEDYGEFKKYINKTFPTYSYRKCKIILYYFQGYKQHEIAEIYNSSQQAISDIIPRQIKIFKKC